MALRKILDGSPWNGAPIDGKMHPLNIETLWTTAQLAAIGLEVIPPPPPPTPAETAASEVIRKDSEAAMIEDSRSYRGAFVMVLLDELNLHAARTTAILDAIDAATTLANLKTAVASINDVPQRTIQQLKTALRGKLT